MADPATAATNADEAAVKDVLTIIMVGFAMAWLAVTGVWLLFRTMWRHDFTPIRRLAARRGS